MLAHLVAPILPQEKKTSLHFIRTQTKYRWKDDAKIYIHLKFSVKQILVQLYKEKKINQAINSVGWTTFLAPTTVYG